MKKRYIIGLDAGTTSVRSVIYDIVTNKIICLKRATIRQYYPQKGYVEQDAEEIYFMLKNTMEQAIAEVDKPLDSYIGIGLTNQRETIVSFNKETGKPTHKAIVWQDRRTNDYIQKISPEIQKEIKNITGLIPDAYFSASKIKWILENSKRSQELLKNNKLYIGTLDSYLSFKFTGKFVTDTTNASRTMLMNLKNLSWDEQLLKIFNIPKQILPTIISSAENIGIVTEFNLPLLSIIGDQQSSLFGNGAIDVGSAKNTYGTGCFMLLNTGEKIVKSQNLLTTVAYTICGKTHYALEGSVFSACSALNWTKENLSITEDYESLDKKMLKLNSNSGIYFVPAFSGLGSPYWIPNAQTNISGITFDTNKYMILRSVYESMAYNTKAILDEMTKCSNIKINELRVDGGGSKSQFLLSFQADMIDSPVSTGQTSEATVLGCIYLAGLVSNYLSIQDIQNLTKHQKIYSPTMDEKTRNKYYSSWNTAVKKSIT